jgi:ferrous iron transport protein A
MFPFAKSICSFKEINHGKEEQSMQRSHTSLSTLREGEHAIIHSIRLEETMRRRLQDLGLIEGTQVECLQKSPSGDPVAYLIRGAAIALRSRDTGDIYIQ